MKKLLALAFVAVSAFSLSGCVILHMETEIGADGSGTMSASISMSETVQQCLVEMKELDGGQSDEMDFPAFDDIDGSKIREAGKDWGVKVEKFEKTTEGEREKLDFTLSFKDLKGLSYVMNNVLGDGTDNQGMGIFAAGENNLVLRTATYDFPPPPAAEDEPEVEEPASPEDMDPEKMAKQMEIMGRMMGAIAELDVSMRITVPGDIVESNAPQTDGRTSIWTINASNMMSAESDMEPEIVFSGKGLKIKPLKE